jgi:molecular chaperone DnaK (HSP70)
MGKAIGIDLGTTNSVACFFDGQQARVLLNSQQEELTPSVVGFEPAEEDGGVANFHVGRTAVNQAKLYPADTIYSIKRLMGKRFADPWVQRWMKKVSYQIVETAEPDPGLAAVLLGGQERRPEDVSAMILAEIKRACETVLKDEVTHAVITVPAYFGEPEKAATREAGRRAGLIVKRLLPEPTAAAIAFGHLPQQRDDANVILVFDLGGGTFDVSIISLVGSDYNVMHYSGDAFLGGDDFDAEIVNMILRHVKDHQKVDLAADRRFLVVAKAEAEAAKKALSNPTTEFASIVIPEAAWVNGRPINVRLRVTRADFEEAIRPHVERCRQLVLQTLSKEGLSPDVISDVLLVGGSTAVPLVYRMLGELFGEGKVRREVNPMHGVGVGAGILAARMKGIECPKCKKVCDESNETCPDPACGASLAMARSVTEHVEVSETTGNHFGIQAVSGADAMAFTPLIKSGTQVPMKAWERKTFYTVDEGQTRIRVPIYEGLGSTVTQNTYIGSVEDELPVGLVKGHPVVVELLLDRNMIVRAAVEVEGLGRRTEKELKRGRAPERPEEPLMEDDAEPMDEQEKALAQLEVRVNWAQHFSKTYEAILTQPQRTRLEEAIREAHRVLHREEFDAADRVSKNLEGLVSSCGTASLIEQARLIARAADGETASRLNALADELHGHAEKGRYDRVSALREPITSLIRQVQAKIKGIEEIESAETYGGLLGDRARGGQPKRPGG